MRRWDWIVCEKSGICHALLRNAMGLAKPRAMQTRSLWECRAALTEQGSRFLIVELNADNLHGLCSLLESVESWHSYTHSLVVASRPLAELEWVVREAGALEFIVSPRQIPRLVEVIRRGLESAIPEKLPVEERIRAQLPWNRPAARRPENSNRG